MKCNHLLCEQIYWNSKLKHPVCFGFYMPVLGNSAGNGLHSTTARPLKKMCGRKINRENFIEYKIKNFIFKSIISKETTMEKSNQCIQHQWIYYVTIHLKKVLLLELNFLSFMTTYSAITKCQPLSFFQPHLPRCPFSKLMWTGPKVHLPTLHFSILTTY